MTTPSMHARAFVSPSCWPSSEPELEADESHHLLRVLRVREGREIEVLNGRGGVGAAVVDSIRGEKVRLRIRERREAAPPPVRVTLLQALPREQQMDLIIQKATELGVSAVVPLMTAHSIVKLDAAKARQRRERWERIALGAIKQSGNPWLPSIETPCALEDALARVSGLDLLLVGALREGARPLREVLREAPSRRPLSIGALVGPEGDFTDAELEGMSARGAQPVGFGNTVLRVETAAVFILSALRYEFG